MFEPHARDDDPSERLSAMRAQTEPAGLHRDSLGLGLDGRAGPNLGL